MEMLPNLVFLTCLSKSGKQQQGLSRDTFCGLWARCWGSPGTGLAPPAPVCLPALQGGHYSALQIRKAGLRESDLPKVSDRDQVSLPPEWLVFPGTKLLPHWTHCDALTGL